MNRTRSPERVRVSTQVAVDPEAAFEVFTREVDAWWKQGPRFRADPGRPSRMRFEPGVGGRLLEIYDEAAGEAFELGRIEVWEPGRRLVFEMFGRDFGPEDTTRVEVCFEPVPEGTRVTVEHGGWEAFPPGHPVRHGLTGTAFSAMMGTWWGDLLVALRGRAQGRPRSDG
jgi:hypothetical protein